MSLLMGSALFAAFAAADHDTRADALSVLQHFPPHHVANAQLILWSHHRCYLERLAEQYPRGDEGHWIGRCREPYHFWETLTLMQRADLPYEDRLRRLHMMRLRFPHYWRTGTHPPLLPDIQYAVPLD